MRISYSEDEDYSGQFELWRANCERSIRGRKGQAALKELEAALVALPTKRLIEDELDDGVDVCAIGAMARYKGITPQADADFEMEEVGMECGLPRLVAWRVVEENDTRWPHMTPEERYNAMLAWVRRKLSE